MLYPIGSHSAASHASMIQEWLPPRGRHAGAREAPLLFFLRHLSLVEAQGGSRGTNVLLPPHLGLC